MSDQLKLNLNAPTNSSWQEVTGGLFQEILVQLKVLRNIVLKGCLYFNSWRIKYPSPLNSQVSNWVSLNEKIDINQFGVS